MIIHSPCCWTHEFNLHNLPIELSNAVFKVLSIIRTNYFPALLPQDAKDYVFYFEELSAWAEELKKVNLMHDPEAALKYSQIHLADFLGFFDPHTPLDMQNLLERMQDLVKPTPDWQKPGSRKPATEAREILRSLQGWEEHAPELYQNIWARFLEVAAPVIKQLEKDRRKSGRADSNPYCSLAECEETFSCAHILHFGEQFINDFAEQTGESMMQAGEEPTLRLHLSEETLSAVSFELEAFATGYGLLALAVHTQKLQEQEGSKND